jgi:two-component system cell cycle sensor histidine kinase PleC
MSDCAAQQPKEDPRYCHARLRTVLGTLPVTIVLNPLSVVVAILAMLLIGSDFGPHPANRIVTAILAQGLPALVAFVVYRRFSGFPFEDLSRARLYLIATQALIGFGWGAVAWALWNEGANNSVLLILLVMSLSSLAFIRCAVRTVFLTGVATLTLPLALLFLTSGDTIAHVLLAFLPLVVSYVVLSGLTARNRVNEMLSARFAMEDLSQALMSARDEAIGKRREAEIANASKTTFLANMSHELRTPLNAIIGFSEIIATEALGKANPRYPEYACDIHSSGTHLLALINEILDVAKIEAGRMEIDPRPLDLVPHIEAIEKIMSIRCQEKELEIVYEVAPNAPLIWADERAFRQILINLVSNAVKFSPVGGKILVRCAEGDAEPGLLVSVADHGPGIPADKLALLFQPFAQVDNRFDTHHGGTGLGLALVEGLAKLHGGRAWLESGEGRGTTAYVYFPLVPLNGTIQAAAE